ncbi:MAG: metal-sulfur cluster assembly factor [Aquificaceae bacterium]|nr:metal-sulfur cluster assembly factor [Aquificaceae bacterium]
MELEILESLKEISDPEIPLNTVNLGLIYGVQVNGVVAYIDMTLTVPSCPAKGFDVIVNFLFEPAWSKDKISGVWNGISEG